jgi:hypothetical protein
MFNESKAPISFFMCLLWRWSSRVSVYRSFFNRRKEKNRSTEAAMLRLLKRQAHTEQL